MKNDEYSALIARMTPELCARLRSALELGRWPDGKPLTLEQKENALQAVIAWDAQNLPVEQRVGYVRPKQTQLTGSGAVQSTQTLRWEGSTTERDRSAPVTSGAVTSGNTLADDQQTNGKEQSQ